VGGGTAVGLGMAGTGVEDGGFDDVAEGLLKEAKTPVKENLASPPWLRFLYTRK